MKINTADIDAGTSTPGQVIGNVGGKPVWITPAGAISITDGTTTEANVTEITFAGATVTSTGAGEATVTITGGGSSSGSSTLAALTDVETTGAHAPADGEALVWSVADSKWKPGAAADASSGTLVKIAEIVLAADGPTISFTNIPAGYRNLIIRGSVRSTAGATRDDCCMSFNGDSGANYTRNLNAVDNAGQAYTWDATRTQIPTVWAPAGNAGAGFFGTFETTVYDYDQSDRNKGVAGLGMSCANVGDDYNCTLQGMWFNTAPITTVSFANAANFKAGSRIALYGEFGPASVDSGIASFDSIETAIGARLARIAALNPTNNLADDANIDFVADLGGYVGICFIANTEQPSGSMAIGTSYTVPAGCVAVCIGGSADDQIYTNAQFYSHRLYNVTQNTLVAGFEGGGQNRGDGWAIGRSGTFGCSGGGNPNNHSFPVAGVAGDVLQAQAWTSGDGNWRIQDGRYYLVIVNATTGELLPVLSGVVVSNSLASHTVTAAESSITLTIPVGARNIKLVASVRGTDGAANQDCMMTFNGDASANYSWNLLQLVNGASPTGYSNGAKNNIPICYMPCAGAPAGQFGSSEVTITSYDKTDRTKGFVVHSGSPNLPILNVSNAVWNNTNAINTITFTPNAGNFEVGSEFDVYAL